MLCTRFLFSCRVCKWTYGAHAAPKKLSCQWLRFNCDSASAWAGPLWTAYVSVYVTASVGASTYTQMNGW